MQLSYSDLSNSPKYSVSCDHYEEFYSTIKEAKSRANKLRKDGFTVCLKQVVVVEGQKQYLTNSKIEHFNKLIAMTY